MPIKQYAIPPGVETGLNYPILYEEFEAVVAAGLDMWEWMYGRKYTTLFKNQVLAWFRMHKTIEAHANDAQTKEMKRKGRG